MVALKLLEDDDASPERLQRFRRELQTARKITHPNVVRIHDIVELPGRFGLTMELVDGETLTARLARGPLSRAELVALAHDLARALAGARTRRRAAGVVDTGCEGAAHDAGGRDHRDAPLHGARAAR